MFIENMLQLITRKPS